jgi:hypothetical protein
VRSIPITALVLALGIAGTASAGGVPLVDASGGSHGSASVNLTKGSVKLKVTGLPRLPATAPLGAGFDAYVYKAYLVSSADAAVEVYLADVFPSSSGSAKVKVAPKGDVSALGLDRLVVTAYSKDARGSFDVLTATLP